MNVDTELKSDDNEYARYLAQYLKDNLSIRLEPGTCTPFIDAREVENLIKQFEDTMV